MTLFARFCVPGQMLDSGMHIQNADIQNGIGKILLHTYEKYFKLSYPAETYFQYNNKLKYISNMVLKGYL